MKKLNDDLLSLEQVCEYFGLSESTIRRKVRASRDGIGNFPLPLFSANSRVLFRRCDIQNWAGEDTGTISFSQLPAPQSLQSVQPRNAAQVRKGLEALGVKFEQPINKSIIQEN